MDNDLGKKDKEDDYHTQEKQQRRQNQIIRVGNIFDNCHDRNTCDEGLRHGEDRKPDVFGFRKFRFDIPSLIGLVTRSDEDAKVHYETVRNVGTTSLRNGH